VIVERPIWRRYRPRFAAHAVAHVKRGGFAVIVPDDDSPVRVYLPTGARGRITELGEWAMLSIDHRRWRTVKDGLAKGLVEVRVRKEFEGSVLDWCARDAVHEGPLRALDLDCLACGACCRGSYVVVGERDFERYREGGRPELASEDFIRRGEDGRLVLRLVNEQCPQLQPDNACTIYDLRPESCRAFLMGSEACLAAREETLGLRDGDALV
jgi:hypothetical protein